MLADRPRSNAEPTCNLFVGEAICDQPKNVVLPRRKMDLGFWRISTPGVNMVGSDRTRNNRPVVPGCPHGSVYDSRMAVLVNRKGPGHKWSTDASPPVSATLALTSGCVWPALS